MVIFRTSALKRKKHIAQSVGVKGTLRRHAWNPYLLRDPGPSPGRRAEEAGVGAGTEERKRSPVIKGGDHQHLQTKEGTDPELGWQVQLDLPIPNQMNHEDVELDHPQYLQDWMLGVEPEGEYTEEGSNAKTGRWQQAVTG